MKASINVEGAFSLGLSENLKGAVVVGSTQTDIDDIPGVSLIGKDGYSGNLAGCLHLCVGYLPGLDNKFKQKSKAFLFGWGEGWDVSANIAEVSDYIYKVDSAKRNKAFISQ